MREWLSTDSVPDGDVEVGAVQRQPALVLRIDDERERAQVADGGLDAFLLQRRQPLVLRRHLMRGEHLQAGVVEHRHPARDELRLGLNGGALVEGGFDAAAARVAHDDKVLDAQVEHGELDGRADAVELAAGLVGRHQIGDVAHDEQLARHGAEDRFRVDAAVASTR